MYGVAVAMAQVLDLPSKTELALFIAADQPGPHAFALVAAYLPLPGVKGGGGRRRS